MAIRRTLAEFSDDIATADIADGSVTAAKVASDVATTAGTQTLTNKTLTSPTLTTPALGTPASGVVTNLSGVLPSGVTGGSGLTNGITHADSWHITSAYSAAAAAVVDDNWASVGGGIGTAMTTPDVSGYFAFPATGIWYIHFQFYMYAISLTPRHIDCYLMTKVGSDAEVHAVHVSGSISESEQYGTAQTLNGSYLYNVTGLTQKVRIKYECETDIILSGDSVRKDTGIDFIRLGDT